MKSIKEIEKMGLEELLEVSSDENVKVPEGFVERIEDGLETLRTIEALTEEETSTAVKMNPFRRRVITFIGAAAAVAILAGFGFGLIENEPEDTFDDPRLAYAELEKAFATISGGISKGVAMAEDTERIIEKTTEIFN